MIKNTLKRLYFLMVKMVYKNQFQIGINSKIAFNKFHFKRDCRIIIGKDSLIEANIYFDKEEGQVIVGDRTFIGGSKLICANRIEIGNDTLISWGCTIVDHDSHSLVFSERINDVKHGLEGKKDWDNVLIKQVTISDKVWIGFDVRILKGVNVGEGAVIAAGSLVTKDVLPYTLVAGVPARFVKTLERVN